MGGRRPEGAASGERRRGDLRAALEAYDARLFRGRMSARGVRVAWCRSRRYYGSYSPASRVICISADIAPLGALGGWRGVLVHEMIHADLHLSGLDPALSGSDIAEDHSEIFWARTRRIGRALDLPDCAEWEAWAWPWCLGDGTDLDLGWPGAR
jgi:hypothetical protein